MFAAWATAEAKARWFAGGSEWVEKARRFDFRVGGTEHLRGVWKSGAVSVFDAVYHDIVQNERIIYAYDMRMDDTKISVSLATVEFAAESAGTRLTFTEQAAFLDSYDDAGSRERGTRRLLENLAASLR